jgi:hypothetical protein
MFNGLSLDEFGEKAGLGWGACSQISRKPCQTLNNFGLAIVPLQTMIRHACPVIRQHIHEQRC